MKSRGVVVFVVAAMFVAAAGGVSAGVFADVPSTHWAYGSIRQAVEAGVLEGHDGQFEGNRLLNRYQMAVVVSRLLEVGREGRPVGMSRLDWDHGMRDLEALTIEFADELAILEVRVATLESEMMDLRIADYEQKPVVKGYPGTGGFSALASVALVRGDEDWGAADSATDEIGIGDGTSFEIPQVSLGLNREVTPGVHFHAHLDFASLINDGGDDVTVNEAYFYFENMMRGISGKAGAFALPFSKEHTGPFRTCDLTVSGSVLSSYVEGIRGYGLEMSDSLRGRHERIEWTFGVLSGTDEISPGGLAPFRMTATQPIANAGRELDDEFGWYVQLAEGHRDDRPFGWYAGYFCNGGDDSIVVNTSPETSFLVLGADYAEGDVRVLAGYLDGSSKFGTKVSQRMWYVLVNLAMSHRSSMTFRYDDWKVGDGGPDVSGDAITFALNTAVTANSLLQFEWVSPSLDRAPGDPEVKDDLLQIRYRVHF